MPLHAFHRITLILIIIGAINWGLIGFFKFDLVATLFGGQDAFFSRIVYALVGLSGLASIALLFRSSKDVEQSGHQRSYNDLDYSTEFGQETDFDDSNNKKGK